MDIQLMFVVKYLRNSFERTHWEICSALIFSQTFASEKEEIFAPTSTLPSKFMKFWGK